MRQFITGLCAAFALIGVSQVAMAAHEDALVTRTSAHSVTQTLDRLEAIVREKGFTVFARIDHAAGAAKVERALRPTQLLIFGNPKVGTALMSSAQSVGLDLPIRVVAYEDLDGTVHLSYTAPAALAARHHIGDRDQIVKRMTKALEGFTTAAAAP
ncbi:MAG: DUF302 domain-containing protein [Pseudomonadota bacterium]